ncbi:hypothetical protein [Roseomonas sp. KE0001]|uniref:hypothetical protein n=1 Tax=Roseomonas sp. KE0001 TaxID=2479201 RepID=UPI0018DFB6FA|nr:hypothetical protein [Roseomonas sp. KE0001]MBI0436082.1 hypothetical protein [Roseomonas sp. KE0001]
MMHINDPIMTEALAWLRAKGIPHEQKTAYQIKVGRRISYYPRTGAINLDTRTGSEAYRHRGLRALEQLIKARTDDL